MTKTEEPSPRPPLTKEEREARDAQRREDAAKAMAEHDAAELHKRQSMERLRAKRLAREADGRD